MGLKGEGEEVSWREEEKKKTWTMLDRDCDGRRRRRNEKDDIRLMISFTTKEWVIIYIVRLDETPLVRVLSEWSGAVACSWCRGGWILIVFSMRGSHNDGFFCDASNWQTFSQIDANFNHCQSRIEGVNKITGDLEG